MTRTLRIAQVAPPQEPVPPRGYGGTERVVSALVDVLIARGHHVTTFASGDSTVAGDLVPTVERALRPDGYRGDPAPWIHATVRAVLERAAEFDVIHAHLEWANPVLALTCRVPVISTFHGRLDLPWAAGLLAGVDGLVAISRSQAASHPEVRWTDVVHNGLPLERAAFETRRDDDLVFLGRIAPEKGILDAFEIARRTGRTLRIIAKRPVIPAEVEYHERVYLPALRAAGSLVVDFGELGEAERDVVVAHSHSLVMPGSWPEPFGLAAIEALACGTPVVARPVGALPEIVRDGIDGFLAHDVDGMAAAVARVADLDRAAVRASVIERFSAERMARHYELLYLRAVAGGVAAAGREPVPVGPGWDVEAPALSEPPMREVGRRAARIELRTRG